MSASQQQVRNSSFIALRGQDVTPLPSVTGTGRVLPEAAPSVLTEADHAMPHEDADTLRIARQYPAGGAFTVPGLFIAESREIPAEIGGAGLYTSRRLEVGTLLGFYEGDIFSDEAYAKVATPCLDHYAMDVRDRTHSFWAISSPPIADDQCAPDLRRFPLAAMNEVSKSSKSSQNVGFMTVHPTIDEVDHRTVGALLSDQVDGHF